MEKHQQGERAMIPVADTWDWLEVYQMNFHQFLGTHFPAFFAEGMYLNLQQWNLEVNATYTFKAWSMESSHMQSSILLSHCWLSFRYWLNAEKGESLEDGATLGGLEAASLNDCMKQSPFLTSFDCDVMLLQHLALLNISPEDDLLIKKSGTWLFQHHILYESLPEGLSLMETYFWSSEPSGYIRLTAVADTGEHLSPGTEIQEDKLGTTTKQ